MTRQEMIEKKEFHLAALSALRSAYLAIAQGGVQSYTIGSRSLSKLDLPKLLDEIKEHEKTIAELDAALNGRKIIRAVGIIPRDF